MYECSQASAELTGSHDRVQDGCSLQLVQGFAIHEERGQCLDLCRGNCHSSFSFHLSNPNSPIQSMSGAPYQVIRLILSALKTSFGSAHCFLAHPSLLHTFSVFSLASISLVNHSCPCTFALSRRYLHQSSLIFSTNFPHASSIITWSFPAFTTLSLILTLSSSLFR